MKHALLGLAAFLLVVDGRHGEVVSTTASCEMTIRFESPPDWECRRDENDCTVCDNRSDHPTNVWMHCEGDAATPDPRRIPAGAELVVCPATGRQRM